jgi:hypothetical protein
VHISHLEWDDYRVEHVAQHDVEPDKVEKCAKIRCIWRTAKGAMAIASMGKRLMGVRRFQKLNRPNLLGLRAACQIQVSIAGRSAGDTAPAGGCRCPAKAAWDSCFSGKALFVVLEHIQGTVFKPREASSSPRHFT